MESKSVKKVYYDVLTREDNKFTSQFFTVQDFLNIMKNSFLSFSEFSSVVKEKASTQEERDFLIQNAMNFHNPGVFDSYRAASMRPILANDKRLKFTSLFAWKVMNFQKNSMPMFDFYVNKRTDLFLDPVMGNRIVSHANKDLQEGLIMIRVINYRKVNDVAFPDFVDINTMIHVDSGLLDSQMRAVPWYLDEFINKNVLKLGRDEHYVMSPLLHHCLKIYDKILLLAKQKNSHVYPMFLKNAIDASFNDARIVAGMNEKYRYLNSTFIRVVPALYETEWGKPKPPQSRFFNVIFQQDTRKAFSYSDVVTGGSGEFGSNKIKLQDYASALQNMNAEAIAFTKEENSNSGLFAWLLPEFSEVVSKYNKLPLNSSHLSNHMISIDYEKEIYFTAVNGPQKMIPLFDRDLMAVIKKWNQRFKLANSRTFLYDSEDQYNKTMIVKNIDGQYSFQRDVNYLTGGKEIYINPEVGHRDDKKFIRQNYTRNALVAFISNDVHIYNEDDAAKLSVSQMNEWFFSLRGVACEVFFSEDFLKQRMVVPRTEKVKSNIEDTSDWFQDMVRRPKEYTNQLFYRHEGDEDRFLVRYYQDCQCGEKIVNDQCRSCGNPRPVTGELIPDYWVDFKKGFDFVTIESIQVVDDGVNLHLNYSIPLANSRFKDEEMMKSVPVESGQDKIGYITNLNLGDISISGIRIPLDGSLFGLGGYKSKTNGIPFSVLRLYNALKGEIVFDSKDCLENTDKVNAFLKDFKKSIIETTIYNSETKQYELRKVEAWVGLAAISPTEVSQEYNKSRFEDERSFSKANYALNNLLGFNELNNALAEENELAKVEVNEFRNELFKIAAIHSSCRPMIPDPNDSYAVSLANKHDALLKGLNDLTPAYKAGDKSFSYTGFDTFSLKGYLTRKDYQTLINDYPLFKDPKFENGFYIRCYLRLPSELAHHYNRLLPIEHAIYFPNRQILKNMFEFVGDNNVRMSGLLVAYISAFETLCVSKIGSVADSRIALINKNGRNKIHHNFNVINGSILSAVNDELFYKKGIINQITNIAIPRVMSKQLTSIYCPYDVAIVANKIEFKKVARRALEHKYPDKKPEDFDWSVPQKQEDGTWSKAGWCWYEDIYCASIREPNLFSKQNLNIKQMWSIFRANKEFKNRYGTSFSDMHPGTKGIFLNSVFVVFNLEGDVDGDTIFLAVPYLAKTQQELQKVYDQTSNMQYFDSENKNPVAQAVRGTYLVPSMNYLVDEAGSLNFKLDTLSIGYSEISFHNSFKANIEASANKENIGFLTVSLWFMTYFVDFYIYNYHKFLKLKYDDIPELTDKDKYEILFVFQYLLAQQNGVRAMKDDGAYGKLTYEALVTNTEFETGKAQDLLRSLIAEYKAENAEKGIHIDFSESIEKLFKIFRNMVINQNRRPKDKFKGFGFIKTVNDEVFSYRDSRWTYGGSTSYKHIDCTDMYDPLWLDFQAVFLLVNGRNPDVFIAKFGYDKLLQSLEFRSKEHLHSPLLSFAKDIFNK